MISIDQLLQQPSPGKTLYEETIPLATATNIRLLMPVASVMTVGAVAAFMVFEGFSTAFILLFIVGFSAAEVLMLVFVHKLLRNQHRRVHVTTDELIWIPGPRERLCVPLTTIQSLMETANGDRTVVDISYCDGAPDDLRTLTIPSASPAELVASIEWGRARLPE